MIAPTRQQRQKVTPPQYAARLGCKPSKVLAWIVSGELRAIDAAAVRGSRPRYLIDEADISAFEAGRTVTAPAPATPRRRKLSVKEYF